MTRVTLSYPYKNHKADSTVDLSEQEALDLVHFGRARKPETEKAAAKSEPAKTKEN